MDSLCVVDEESSECTGHIMLWLVFPYAKDIREFAAIPPGIGRSRPGSADPTCVWRSSSRSRQATSSPAATLARHRRSRSLTRSGGRESPPRSNSPSASISSHHISRGRVSRYNPGIRRRRVWGEKLSPASSLQDDMSESSERPSMHRSARSVIATDDVGNDPGALNSSSSSNTSMSSVPGHRPPVGVAAFRRHDGREALSPGPGQHMFETTAQAPSQDDRHMSETEPSKDLSDEGLDRKNDNIFSVELSSACSVSTGMATDSDQIGTDCEGVGGDLVSMSETGGILRKMWHLCEQLGRSDPGTTAARQKALRIPSDKKFCGPPPPRRAETLNELKEMWSSAYSCWCSTQPDLQFAAAHVPVTVPAAECVICYEKIPPHGSISKSGTPIFCWTNDVCGHSVHASCGLSLERQPPPPGQEPQPPTCPLCRFPWKTSSVPRSFLERSGTVESRPQDPLCRFTQEKICTSSYCMVGNPEQRWGQCALVWAAKIWLRKEDVVCFSSGRRLVEDDRPVRTTCCCVVFRSKGEYECARRGAKKCPNPVCSTRRTTENKTIRDTPPLSDMKKEALDLLLTDDQLRKLFDDSPACKPGWKFFDELLSRREASKKLFFDHGDGKRAGCWVGTGPEEILAENFTSNHWQCQRGRY